MLTALVVTALVLIQSLVAVAPDIYWDTDPRGTSRDLPNTMLGPAGMAWMHTASVLAAAVAVGLSRPRVGQAWSRGLSLVLAGLGLVFAAGHLFDDLDSLHRCGAWIGAVSLAVAGYCLSGFDRPRRLMIAGLLALLVPLGLKAIGYVWFEHPTTVRMFLEREAEFLADRGWQEGSPQHLLYKRRLTQPDVTGWYGLSNLFGSVLAALVTLGVATAWGAWRRGMKPVAGALGAVAAVGAVVVYLTNSKGAWLGLALGLAIGGVVWLVHRRVGAWRRVRWGLAPVAVLLCPLVMAGIAAVGAAGPPAAGVEDPGLLTNARLGLLFRYHYWQASLSIAAEAPLTGVGPGDFQALYSVHKNPLNPEEVNSAHNVLVDYVTMLGVGGWAWAALLLGWLWQAGRKVPTKLSEPDQAWKAADQRETAEAGGDAFHPAAVGWSAALATLCFAVQFAMQWPTLMSPEGLLLWVASVCGFVLVAAAVMNPGALSRGWVQVGLFAAATVLLVHNQIEMTFSQVGSSAVAWFVVGLAAAGPAAPKASGEPALGRQQALGLRWIPAVLLLLGGLAMVPLFATPVTQQQATLAEARVALQNRQPQQALQKLGEAVDQLPLDPRLVRWEVTLRREHAQVLAAHNRPDAAVKRLQEALELLRRRLERDRFDDPMLLRQRAMLYTQWYQIERRPALADRAVQAWREALARTPYGLSDHLRLADFLWELGRIEPARVLYRRVLELDEAARLDPARQLTAEQRQRVQRRADG